LHCVVRFLKKIPQTDDEKKRAQECIGILFEPTKTEHYGSFIRCEHETKMNFKNMTDFPIPLVILTWHRMTQEYFSKHDNKTFFHYGNYSENKQRGPKNGLDNLYMIDSLDVEEKILSFDMIHPNSDADVSKEACPLLLEWATYLLEPYADIDNNDDSGFNNDNNLKGPMQSYKITDDEIKWKIETDTNTTEPEAIASAPEEELLWNKFDLSVENKSNISLVCNIAEALQVSHSRYGKLKRLNNAQQDEKDTIELVMLSVMQMHCNETVTMDQKN
jgi:hypothetical protein